MMNGVLEEKKEKALDNELKEEEWMKKPREEMTEEEVQKFDAFQESRELFKQEQEKMRKILNQELKKLLGDIRKICEEFDGHLSYLFMKKLEFQYRVFEQELNLIKIQQNLQEQELIKSNASFIDKTFNEQFGNHERRKALCERIEIFYNEIDREREAIETEIAKFETKNLKQILQVVLNQKEDQMNKKGEFTDEKVEKYAIDNGLLKVPENHRLFGIERNFLLWSLLQNPQVYQSMVHEFLSKKFENENEISSEWTRFIKIFTDKVALKRKLKHLAKIRKNIQKLNDGIKKQEDELGTLKKKHGDLISRTEKMAANSFLMFRTCSANIEIPTNKAVFYKSDTILIDRKEINQLNKRICELGNQKVSLLIKNLEEKSKVENELEDLKMLELEVRQSIVETFVLTRLKVSKKLQTLIAKKDDRLMETEEKNLKKQIDKLLSATEKMIAIYKKKEGGMKREISFLSKENEELLLHGGKLQESVTQRQEIFDMVFGKSAAEEQDENRKTSNTDGKFDQKTYTKTVDLIKNRKLYDTAKFLAQEIENLMKELRTLQKRTFPNLG